MSPDAQSLIEHLVVHFRGKVAPLCDLNPARPNAGAGVSRNLDLLLALG